MTQTDPVSETMCFLVLRIPDDRRSPETQRYWAFRLLVWYRFYFDLTQRQAMSVTLASFSLISLCFLFTEASIDVSVCFLSFNRWRTPFRSIATHYSITNLLLRVGCLFKLMRGRITLLKCMTLKPSCFYRLPVRNLLFLSWISNPCSIISHIV
jgi:hypothetical protein